MSNLQEQSQADYDLNMIRTDLVHGHVYYAILFSMVYS
jgi:hypothetical protein